MAHFSLNVRTYPRGFLQSKSKGLVLICVVVVALLEGGHDGRGESNVGTHVEGRQSHNQGCKKLEFKVTK